MPVYCLSENRCGIYFNEIFCVMFEWIFAHSCHRHLTMEKHWDLSFISAGRIKLRQISQSVCVSVNNRLSFPLYTRPCCSSTTFKVHIGGRGCQWSFLPFFGDPTSSLDLTLSVVMHVYPLQLKWFADN